MKKLTKILILSLAFVLLFGVVYSSAYVAYDTYTYSISGKQMLSPTAYSTNTSITSTDMGLKDKLPTMSEDEQLQLLATNGMLVKRPLVIGEDFVLTGFKEKEWEEKMK